MRTPPRVGARLTPTERLIAQMLASGQHNYRSIAEHLRVSWHTIRTYALDASKKIEGDLPAQFKLVVWWRQTHGVDVMTGKRIDAE